MSNLLYRLHHSCSRNKMSHMTNTGNETRTRMVFQPMDFKSIASTIPPCQLDVHFLHIFKNLYHERSKFVRRSKISQAGVIGFEPMNACFKDKSLNRLAIPHYLQLFVSWVSCQPNKGSYEKQLYPN